MMNSSTLQSQRISRALAGQPIGHDVQVHDSLDSTSTHTRQLGMQGFPHGTVVTAEEQTAGRGRRENVWLAEPGENLLFSVLLRPEIPLEYWPRLTTMAAVSICKAIEAQTPLQPTIKWPNDIYVDGKKTAGILAETFSSTQGTFMVLGIGLNVNTLHFPENLAATATSLRLEIGPGSPPLSRENLLITLLKELNHCCQCWQNGYDKIITATRQRSLLLGHTIKAMVNGEIVSGFARDLDEEGALIIVTQEGNRLTLNSAEQVRLQ